MDVIRSLGPSKVTLNLETNDYEESRLKVLKNGFDQLPHFQKVERTKLVAKNVTMSKIETLYAIFAKHVDPTMELFENDGEQYLSKVRLFKDGIIKGFDIKAKELGLKKLKSITDEDVNGVFQYLSKLLKNHIFVTNSCSLFKASEANLTDAVVVLSEEDDKYIRQQDVTLAICYKKISSGVENKLVKEVREVAGILDIPLYDDGVPKKLLPKKALLDKINNIVS